MEYQTRVVKMFAEDYCFRSLDPLTMSNRTLVSSRLAAFSEETIRNSVNGRLDCQRVSRTETDTSPPGVASGTFWRILCQGQVKKRIYLCC